MISKNPSSASMEALSGASADIPFTDMTLLSVSVAGFCVLAVTIYKIILAKTGNATSAHNGHDDNDTEQLTMEERLLRADVSTLNRAQRRARAKAIMKEQRRGVVPSHLENNNNNNNNNIDAALAVFDEGDPAVAGVVAPPVGLLSRRERHAAAKATERHERMQCHGERQRQQDEAEQRAQQLKQERIQQERWIMERQRFAEEQHQEQLLGLRHSTIFWFVFWHSSICAVTSLLSLRRHHHRLCVPIKDFASIVHNNTGASAVIDGGTNILG